MKPDILQKVDLYRRGLIGRRELLKSLVAVTGGMAAASLFLETSGLAALPPTVQDQAANVDVETVHFPSGDISVEAYVAKPKGGAQSPAVLVIHENRGLNDYIRGVTRRFAEAGFIAMAPDLLSRVGGTSKVGAADAPRALNGLPADAPLDDSKAGYTFLSKYPGVDATKVSVVGFGWGGWRSFMLATMEPDLFRAVVFYGSTPTVGLQNIHAPVLAHYAEFDFRVTGNCIFTEDTLTKMGKKFTYYVYPKTFPAFFNSAAGERFDADAAKLAWSRTLDFLHS